MVRRGGYRPVQPRSHVLLRDPPDISVRQLDLHVFFVDLRVRGILVSDGLDAMRQQLQFLGLVHHITHEVHGDELSVEHVAARLHNCARRCVWIFRD